MKSIYRNYCKGQIVILFAISLIVLIGIVGLAIDSGRAYGVKAKMSAALDAAAIAAANGLTIGQTDQQRVDNANIAAQKFFYANFPPNYLGVTSRQLATITKQSDPTLPNSAVHSPDGYWTINVSATATMPTTFINVLNWRNVNVGATGSAIRRDLDMILVLDVSGSLSGVFSTNPGVKQAATDFVNSFIESTDRVGLVAFSSGAQVKVTLDTTSCRGFCKYTAGCSSTCGRHDINNNLPLGVVTEIGNLTNGGGTASAEGMRLALNEINAVPAAVRSSLRVIVFFSDGAPNGVPATFNRTSGNPNPVTGDLYSETAATGSVGACGNGAPCAVYPYNQLNGTNTSYTNISPLPNDSGATLTLTSTVPGDANGSIALASYNNSRPLFSYTNTRCNVNRAARNMVENVANSARSQGQPVAVYTLGLGDMLNTNEIGFCSYDTTEYGANILARLANATGQSPPLPSQSSQPTGLYCFAATASQLTSCFNAIKSDMLRLSK